MRRNARLLVATLIAAAALVLGASAAAAGQHDGGDGYIGTGGPDSPLMHDYH